MKLSDAIENGLEISPQVYRGSLFDVTKARSLRSCALGSALLGASPELIPESVLREDMAGRPMVPELFLEDLCELMSPIPQKAQGETTICGQTWFIQDIFDVTELVVYLNDTKKWSRRKIAQYLRDRGWDPHFNVRKFNKRVKEIIASYAQDPDGE